MSYHQVTFENGTRTHGVIYSKGSYMARAACGLVVVPGDKIVKRKFENAANQCQRCIKSAK